MATTSLHEAIRVLYERSLLLQKSGEKAEGISSIRTKASEVLALCDREMSLKPSTAPVIHNTSTGTAPSNLRSKNSHKNTREDGLMPETVPPEASFTKSNLKTHKRDIADVKSSEETKEVKVEGRNAIKKVPATPQPASESSVKMELAMDVSPVRRDETLESYLTEEEFSSLPILPATKRALEGILKYRKMSVVQAAAIPLALEGFDELVKARTGTGKTLAFLIPAINNLMAEMGRSSSVRPIILAISPTRELTLQIATEAVKLCTFHGLKVVTLVGGTSVEGDKRQLYGGERGADIIVGTPGRLLDHLESDARFAKLCGGIRCQCLDEVDRLLDQGFKRDLDKILRLIAAARGALKPTPSWQVQTLLFSATMTDDIREIARGSLRKGYKVVNTVGEDEDQTHSHVPQYLFVAPLEDQVAAMGSILESQMRDPEYKIIAFFATARQTEFFAALFNAAGVDVLEMHSRKSQPARIKTAELFRSSSRVVMFSSDVSARGMDYPNVTFVLQVGLTDKSQYIHRLGRTARAGKQGSGLLLLAPFEEDSMRKALGTDITLLPYTPGPVAPSTSSLTSKALALISGRSASTDEIRKSAISSSIAWLGFYNSNLRRLNWTKTDLVAVGHDYARSIGLKEIPPIMRKTLGKMGLNGTPGLKVE